MIKKAICTTAFLALSISPALAWGTAGHRMINQAAMQTLPDTMPAFLRSPDAIHEITMLGPEADRLKGSGYPHDGDEDPGHYLDALDDLSIAHVLRLNALPDTRAAYDTALRAAHTDQYRQGFLPYSIIDGWEAVRKDFAYWRAEDFLAQHAATPEDRAWFATDRTLRETLTLRDIGVWGHYVADGSQPLHVTVHFNGWGKFPNPKNYSNSGEVHSSFESGYVTRNAKLDGVQAIVAADPVASFIAGGATSKVQTAAAIAQIEAYLAGSAQAVGPLYVLEAKNSWSGPAAAANTDFVQHQLARGAREYRDLIVAAYESSLTQTVAYPEIPLQDILSGKTVPTAHNFGSD